MKMRSSILIILLIFSIDLFPQTICDKYSREYIPTDLYDALSFLDCIWKDTDKDSFKIKPEGEAVSELHFGTGMAIRNNWGLWKGDSDIAKYFREMGVSHPDDISGIILTSFHRYLNKDSIRLNEQIEASVAYWERARVAENKRKAALLSNFQINDTVDFLYNFDFISDDQERKYMDDICIAKGIVRAKDSIDFQLQIQLIDSCDDEGIIISFGDVYVQKDSEWVLVEEDKTEIMVVGDIRWSPVDYWREMENW